MKLGTSLDKKMDKFFTKLLHNISREMKTCDNGGITEIFLG